MGNVVVVTEGANRIKYADNSRCIENLLRRHTTGRLQIARHT
jgi:hypothetical protein